MRKEFHGNFAIGVISSKLSLEGPIIKDKNLVHNLGTQDPITTYWRSRSSWH